MENNINFVKQSSEGKPYHLDINMQNSDLVYPDGRLRDLLKSLEDRISSLEQK